MKETKLISVRIPVDVLEKMDLLGNRYDYYSRSELINAALRVMVADDTSNFAKKALHFFSQFGDVIDKLEFEYHREHK